MDGLDKLHETQRTLVNDQIGALLKAKAEQDKAEANLRASAVMIPAGIASAEFAETAVAVADEPAPETDVAMLSIYARRVAPVQAPTP